MTKPSAPIALPEGISAWDQVLKSGDVAAPWPFSHEHWEKIRHIGKLNNILENIVLLSARRYCYAEYLLKTRPMTQRPEEELAALVSAAASLRAALNGLGDDALDHMASYRFGGPSPEPASALRREPPAVAEARQAARDHFRRIRAPALVRESLTGIEWALDRLERDNGEALANPPKNRRGRSTRFHEKWLNWRLYGVFRAAHPGQRQPQGFPAFFDACATPLGLPERSPKGREELRQSVLRKAKARKKSAEKADLSRGK